MYVTRGYLPILWEYIQLASKCIYMSIFCKFDRYQLYVKKPGVLIMFHKGFIKM